MARRYEIYDAQWEKIKPYLGNTPKKTGRPQVDNRKLLNGVLWIMHTGAPWRDLPECYGPWQTVYKRFSQWQKDEKLRQLFENVRENPDMQDLCYRRNLYQSAWYTDFYHYKERHLVECFFMKIKEHHRIATRFEKLACRFLVSYLHSFGGCSTLACIILPVGHFRNIL